MKNLVLLLLLLVAISSDSFPQLNYSRIIDLTYSFDENTIYWPTEEGFKLTVQAFGETQAGFFYSANSFCAAEHGGTHIDAPIHFFEGRQSVDEIPLSNLMGNAVVIDVTMQCQENRDYLIMTEDIFDWEESNGEIPPGSIVLFKTGFGEYWPDRKMYMGTDKKGDDGVKNLSFPGLHPNTAVWLISQRNIKAVGIDTPSIDFGKSTSFEAHVKLAEGNVPIIENVANMELLPAKDFTVIALPMKIANGSGGPARVIALVK